LGELERDAGQMPERDFRAGHVEPLLERNLDRLLGDPTKVPRDATEEQFLDSVSTFAKICQRPPRKRHYL